MLGYTGFRKPIKLTGFNYKSESSIGRNCLYSVENYELNYRNEI